MYKILIVNRESWRNFLIKLIVGISDYIIEIIIELEKKGCVLNKKDCMWKMWNG